MTTISAVDPNGPKPTCHLTSLLHLPRRCDELVIRRRVETHKADQIQHVLQGELGDEQAQNIRFNNRCIR